MTSFINIPTDSDFSIYNIPFGIGSIGDRSFVCTRVGDAIIDLSILNNQGVFDTFSYKLDDKVFENEFLNDFIALSKAVTTVIRTTIQTLLSSENNAATIEKVKKAFHTVDEVTMKLPIRIGDYTDFYSSREHAYNVGVMFRDPSNALLPNWLHLPVGYHGRSSSIVVSGRDVKRPSGQTLPPNHESPVFGKTKQLDFELEMGFVVGKSTDIGTQVAIQNAEDHIFGLSLFNDWSARDIQKWEYVPLGPFLAKNFCSTISPWIITLEALEPFRIAGPVQEPQVMDYLKVDGMNNYDIALEVEITANDLSKTVVSHSNFKFMYWNMLQQLAHHTVNGCNINVGDLLASGTISGPTPDSYGSMLEIAWKGTKPVTMTNGETRTFIQDGDTVTLKGHAQKDGIRVGFGECSGKIIG